jgi:hypothetical protein
MTIDRNTDLPEAQPRSASGLRSWEMLARAIGGIQAGGNLMPNIGHFGQSLERVFYDIAAAGADLRRSQ